MVKNNDLQSLKNNLYNKGYLPYTVPENLDLVESINHLKKEKNAIILAHYYQIEAIQAIADIIGDSLQLAQKVSQTDADIILMSGVRFMAETAKILNPTKKVILPDLHAGCSLADSCPPEKFKAFLKKHPNHIVVSYINCTAEIKALSDIICTSSNALKIIQSIPKNKPIIFAPDKNLGKYLIKTTGRDMLLWNGTCIVHETFSLEKILQLQKKYPQAQFIAHPESEEHILQIADFIGSTTKLINHVKKHPAKIFIVATEVGILYQMKKEAPQKKIIPAPILKDIGFGCHCSICHYMKMNTMEKLYICLKHELPEITLDQKIQEKALVPLNKMLQKIE